MSSSSGNKIIKKVFYTTGEMVAEADKLKDSLLDIAKSFQVGYHLLSGEAPSSNNVNGNTIKECDQQLDSLYGYFGKIIFENIAHKDLSFYFNPGYEISYPSQEPSPSVFKKAAEASPSVDDLGKINSEDPLIRLKAVVQLSKLNTPQARLELLSHSKDPDTLIRRVIVNCITPEGGEDETFGIVKMINDPDEDVARIAIRKSAKTRNRLAFTYLISKLESENVKLRQEAINALVEITGADLGFDPAAALNGRNEAVLRWNKVWQDNQMNPQFLINEEATRSILKMKYQDTPSKTPKNHKTPKDPSRSLPSSEAKGSG